MSNNSKFQILYQFDNKYAPYGGVSITSLFENNKDASSIEVYILDDDGNPISEDNRCKFAELEHRYNRTINIINSSSLSRLIEELKIPTYRGCNAANMRLFIDKVLPELNGKLLYLDADSVVCGSLKDLFDKKLDSAIGMVYESQGCGIRNELGLQDEQGYYNSGVILYNLDKWKKDGCSEKIIEHAKNVRAAYVSPDQDLLNVVLKEHITTLEMKYNFQPLHAIYSKETYLKIYKVVPYYGDNEINEAQKLFRTMIEEIVNIESIGESGKVFGGNRKITSCRNNKDVIILHCYRYLGRFPWHCNSNHPFEKIWNYYLAVSPWKGMNKLKSNRSVSHTVERIMYSVLEESLFLNLFRHIQVLIQKNSEIRLEKKNERKKMYDMWQ